MDQRRQLQRQIVNMKQSLIDQGYLDEEQLAQLEELKDDANPNFVEEVVTLYYRDSARLVFTIDQLLEKTPLDFIKLDSCMHQFKGSSSSIGAKKVKAECALFREYCRAGNGEGRCIRTFQQVKKEYTTLRKKLETYFQVARQAGPSQTACRPK
ncbi:Histidine-containing phosphotransfer protein 4 [Linum perenne]